MYVMFDMFMIFASHQLTTVLIEQNCTRIESESVQLVV